MTRRADAEEEQGGPPVGDQEMPCSCSFGAPLAMSARSPTFRHAPPAHQGPAACQGVGVRSRHVEIVCHVDGTSRGRPCSSCRHVSFNKASAAGSHAPVAWGGREGRGLSRGDGRGPGMAPGRRRVRAGSAGGEQRHLLLTTTALLDILSPHVCLQPRATHPRACNPARPAGAPSREGTPPGTNAA